MIIKLMEIPCDRVVKQKHEHMIRIFSVLLNSQSSGDSETAAGNKDYLQTGVSALLALLLILVIAGCGTGHTRLDVDVSSVPLPDTKIHRYDLDLFKVDAGNLRPELERLKPDYRFFLETDLSDTAKLSDMRGYLLCPRNIEFHEAVVRQFSDVSSIEKDLNGAFRHFLHYFPQFRVPRVYAYISGGDYNYPVQLADSVMLIGLDNYLGKEFKPYAADGLPAYRTDRMVSGAVVPDCVRSLVNASFPEDMPGNNLLEQMINAGKRVYFTEAMIPATSDHLIIGYTPKQQEWIKSNEYNLWAAVIENRLLFTTDGKIIRSMMADGPFTAEFSKESPPRLGEWLGWQIVRRYMDKNPGTTLQELSAEKDFQKILSGSAYKPEKP